MISFRNIRFQILILLACSVWVVSCNQRDETGVRFRPAKQSVLNLIEESGKDTVCSDSLFLKRTGYKEIASMIETHLPEWNRYYSRLTPDFRIEKFRIISTVTIEPEEIMPLNTGKELAKFLDLYRPYLIWSTDNQKAIDIFSYNITLEKDENGNIYGFRDVDSQLSIIDLVRHKRIVLMTQGPSVELQDGFWLNRNVFIIAFSKGIDNDTYVPGLMLIDIKTNLARYYSPGKKIQVKENKYLRAKFKEVKNLW